MRSARWGRHFGKPRRHELAVARRSIGTPPVQVPCTPDGRDRGPPRNTSSVDAIRPTDKSGARAPKPAVTVVRRTAGRFRNLASCVFRQLEILLGRLPALPSCALFFISAEASCINVRTSCASFLVPKPAVSPVRDDRGSACPSPMRAPS